MLRTSLSVLVALVLSVSAASAQITIPNTLTAGQVIRAAELNTNFSTLGEKSLNRVTGGTIEGNVSLSADVTMDGVDISDYLRPTGEVRVNTAGTVGSPAFTYTSDTNTGLYYPAADELAVALGGAQKLLLNASGVTAFGVNIINSSGKIPALSSTYIASLDGSALTALNATELTTGTVADARLSANVPLLDAATNTFTGNASFGGTLGVTGTTTLGTLSAAATTVTTFTMATGAVNGYILTTDGSGVGTWQSAGVATGAVPSGLIAIFDTACPATWTRHTDFDNKFIRGGSSYVAVGGGSDTHTHTVDPANTSTTSDGSHNHGGVTGAGGSHSHTTDIAPTTSSSGGAHTHTYSSTSGSGGTHSHTGTTDDGGAHTHTLSVDASGQDGGGFNFINGASTDSGGTHNHTFSTSSGGDHTHSVSGTTASDGSHTHSVDPVSTASSTSSDHTHTIPYDAVSTHNHYVDIASTATSSGANVPAYSQVVFCKKD